MAQGQSKLPSKKQTAVKSSSSSSASKTPKKSHSTKETEEKTIEAKPPQNLWKRVRTAEGKRRHGDTIES